MTRNRTLKYTVLVWPRVGWVPLLLLRTGARFGLVVLEWGTGRGVGVSARAARHLKGPEGRF